MEYMITTNGLSKKYNEVYSVKDLDLKVPAHGVYGFLGPNGAGKSTTLKMVLGLVKPTEGKISVLGKTVSEKNRLELLKNVGSLIESPSYYSHLTGRENLKIFQTLRNLPERNVDEVLKMVRLEEQQNKKVAHYSLGMKQRLGLAVALMSFPKLLILDEPTNGLDPAGIQEIRELIKDLPKQYDMTVIVSSHLLSEIDQMADYVGIINQGELVFEDRLEALHERKQSKIAVRTTDNMKVMQLLREEGMSAEKEEEYLILPYQTDCQIADMGKFLYDHDVSLLRVEERKKTLEEIFLELTGKVASL